MKANHSNTPVVGAAYRFMRTVVMVDAVYKDSVDVIDLEHQGGGTIRLSEWFRLARPYTAPKPRKGKKRNPSSDPYALTSRMRTANYRDAAKALDSMAANSERELSPTHATVLSIRAEADEWRRKADLLDLLRAKGKIKNPATARQLVYVRSTRAPIPGKIVRTLGNDTYIVDISVYRHPPELVSVRGVNLFPRTKKKNPQTSVIRNLAHSHYNVVTQSRPPGGLWRADNLYGPYADLETARRKAVIEADEYADTKGDWTYRAAVYPSDAKGESLTVRRAATVYPSKVRAAAKDLAYRIAMAKRNLDWDAVAKLERWSR